MIMFFKLLAWGSFGLLLAVLGMTAITWQFWVILVSVTALVIMEKECILRSR